MIKDITLALLTTTINRYSSLGGSIRAIHKEAVINDLTGILDYVTDLKEENNQPITVVLNSNGEVEFLKKRIRELEESCGTNNEVIEKQHRKIKELQNSNYRWNTLCVQLKAKNKRFEAENKDLKSRFGVDKLEIMKRGESGLDKLKWLQERQKGIGGSDAGAILRINKWKTPFQIYLEKTEPITEINEQSEAAYWGDQFEEVVAKEFEKRTGKKVRRDRRHFKHEKYPFMVANIDRRVVGENAVLECKTANQFLAKEWEGEEIPASYLVQVQHYLEVTGAEKGYIAVLIGGQKFIWKEVERDEELIEIIINTEKEFWENHVLKKIPPTLDGSSAAEKYLNEKYKKSNSNISIDLKSEYMDKIDELMQLKETIKNLEGQAKEIENNIKNELKEAEIGYAPGYEVNWKKVISNRVDSKLLKEKYLEIYKKVCKESVFRRFNIKNLKEEN